MEVRQFNITERIILLVYGKQKDLASTFLRFQEHYESPEFRGKCFSLAEFQNWYIQNSPGGRATGRFTYYTDWAGFNIPSVVLVPFYDGLFDPLSEQEQEFLLRFKNEKQPFYVIGAHQQAGDLHETLLHEVAHGLFYTDTGYRNAVLEILRTYDTEPIREELRLKAGYHEDVLDDEVNAFMVSGGIHLAVQFPEEMATKLRTLYEARLAESNIRFPAIIRAITPFPDTGSCAP
jgi:hypothetical protein